MDVDFNITIPDFVGVVNISDTGNYTKAWNKANGEGINNDGWGSASDNNKDNNDRKDVGSIKI